MENENYDEILEMVVTELTERGIREQREENPEIDDLIGEQTELSVKVQECLATLDDEVKEILIQYHEQAESIADEQIKYLYLQGAKDCVRSLTLSASGGLALTQPQGDNGVRLTPCFLLP